MCGIAGVSAFANLIVQSFRFNNYAEGGFSLGGGGGMGEAQESSLLRQGGGGGVEGLGHSRDLVCSGCYGGGNT